MNTAVALIIFNRPEPTRRVFEKIARARPPKLFVIADGPRDGHPDDREQCAQTRAVTERIDWECEVHREYSQINLGCGHRPASGITGVFEKVEEAIILEDDCLPDPSFFPFCEELLERYRDDERVMKIGGRNDIAGKIDVPHSYFFWRMGGCWGWATWRRAWKHFDFEISLWPQLRSTPWLLDILGDPLAAQYWYDIFERTHRRGLDANYWDFQWAFAYWAQSGLAVAPRVNLVRNIGFGEGATHTVKDPSGRGELAAGEILFPLEHPPYLIRDRSAEQAFVKQIVLPRLKKKRFRRILRETATRIDRKFYKRSFKEV